MFLFYILLTKTGSHVIWGGETQEIYTANSAQTTIVGLVLPLEIVQSIKDNNLSLKFILQVCMCKLVTDF